MILTDLWNTALYIPIFNALIALYKLFFNDMGLAIIVMTLIIKLVTFPLNQSALNLAQKQKELQPELNELKKKYPNKTEFATKQMELYKNNGINPAGGCLPQIIQIVIVIALYRVFTDLLHVNGANLGDLGQYIYNFDFLKFKEGESLNTNFLYLNLSKSDQFYILPVIAAAFQFWLSKLTMPSIKKLEKIAEKTPDKTDDIMYNMQQQMVYTMPIMTLIIGVNLPSGLVLYWFISTLLGIVQYLLVNKKNKAKQQFKEAQLLSN